MTRDRLLAVLLAAFAALAGAALAGCNVDTQPATDVTSSSATLHAKVSWNEGDIEGRVVYWFETRPRGEQTWTQDEIRNAGSIDPEGNGEVAEAVTGLLPGTRYEFRACAYLISATGQQSGTHCFDSNGQANGGGYDSFTTDAARPGGTAFPNPQTAGTPPGWTPATTTSNSITVDTPGAVIQDVRLTNGADITVEAPNVTIRRVELQGGFIDNDTSNCANGLLIEDATLSPGAGQNERGQEGAISYGGYTARGVEITGRSEGFRVSSAGECGPVTIEDSFVKIVPPDPCGDWHGDGIQSWYGDALTVRNVTIDMRTSGCTGTAPFFRPAGQGNQGAATIDGLLVMGQGYPFRLGTAGTVSGLRIVDESWIFAPVDVDCSLLSTWEAKSVTIDANYQVTSTGGDIACSGTGG
jgi:hypothetical protein